jgi:hypothetical protein
VQFQLSPSDTLESLKNLIAKSKALGRIGLSDQRVFHLGRELKTPGRSLASLGVDASRFGVCVIHVHSRRPGTSSADQEDDSDDDDEVVCVSVHRPPLPPPPPNQVAVAQNRAGELKEVIDLLDDSSDEEDEPSTHRSKRART